MPPYPIKRIPMRAQKWLEHGRTLEPNHCLWCGTQLEGDPLARIPDWPSYLKLCPTCGCPCRYRTEDVLLGSDGLTFPCELHDALLPPYQAWPDG